MPVPSFLMAQNNANPMGGQNDILNLGLQNLANGTVKPEEVQGVLQKQGLKNPWTQSAPGAAVPSQQQKKEQKTTEGTKNAVTKSIFEDPDELNNRLSMLMQRPDMMDRSEGLKKMQDMLDMSMKDQQATPNWIGPLAALVDSQTGSKLSASVPQGNSESDLAKKNFGLMAELQKQKGELNKSVLDELKASKIGTESNSTTQSLLNAMTAGDLGGYAGVKRLKLISDAGAAFDKPIVHDFEKAFNRADVGMGLLNSNNPILPDDYNSIAEDLTRMISQGSTQVADAKLQRESLQLFAEIKSKAAAYVGQEVDMREIAPKMFDRLRKKITEVRGYYRKAYNQQIDQVLANYNHVNDPDIQATVKEKAAMLKAARSGEGLGVPASGKNWPPAGTVEDGHVSNGGDPADPKTWAPVK